MTDTLKELLDAHEKAAQVEELFKRQAGENTWVRGDYIRITSALQDCCQKYRLGLGGEDVCELVIAEVVAARSGSLALRQSEERSAPQITPEQAEWATTGWQSHHRSQSQECLCVKCEGLRAALRQIASQEGSQ